MEKEKTLASVFSLTLHRLQRAPRAIHRAILSRTSLFHVKRTIEGTYYVRALSFLRDELMAETCAVQMISKATTSILFVGSTHHSLIGPALKGASRDHPDLLIRHLHARNGERLLIVDGQTAILGAGRLQICVDGEIARALARSYGFPVSKSPVASSGSSWPFHARLDLEAIEVALSRTIPLASRGGAGSGGAIEIERLTLNAIKSARRFIYIETEAITSSVIIEALARTLRRASGPEVVLILPPKEEHVPLNLRLLSALQAQGLAQLEASDAFDRYRCFERPKSLGLREQAKSCNVIIVDDQFVKVGTSTLTARSLGAEDELDLSVEALGRTPVVMSIARLRRELIGSLLGVEPSEFDARFLLSGLLAGTIESFFHRDRNLLEVRGKVVENPWIRALAPVVDPKRPLSVTRAVRRALKRSAAAREIAAILLMFIALFVMIALQRLRL